MMLKVGLAELDLNLKKWFLKLPDYQNHLDKF